MRRLYSMPSSRLSQPDLDPMKEHLLVLRAVISALDTRTAKLLVALASLLWAFALVIGPQTFDRQAYVFVSFVSNETVWAGVFFLHTLGVLYCLLNPERPQMVALVVNCYGFAIWFFNTLATNLAVMALSPSSSMDWVMVGAQAWVVLKTRTRKVAVKK